ncbi:MAG TPA: DUF3515 family protein [Frankiaceae bacterium]|nr:DUF3515 family protein [Frankiaceae bacterium]
MRTAVVVLLAATAVACSGDDLPAVDVTAVPNAHAQACQRLADRLPQSLGDDLPRRDTTPDDPHVAAYGDPPIVVRCGAPDTGTFEQGDPLLNVNGVSWFYEERGPVVVWSLPTSFVNVEVTIPTAWTGDRLSYLTDAVKAAQGG